MESSGPGTYAVIYGDELDLSGGCKTPSDVFLECQNCSRIYKIVRGCGKRFDYFCPTCAKKWRAKTFKRYWRGVCEFKKAKLITLTLLKKGSMQDRLMSIWAMKKYLFKVLARRGYPIESWCGVIEPPNHIHIVAECGYIPKSEISEIWEGITGDSYIVDIAAVNMNGDPRKVAAYITKYLAKASSWQGMNLDLLKGFHLIGSWNLRRYPTSHALCLCGFMPLHRIDREAFMVAEDMFLRNPDYSDGKFGIYI